MISLCFPVELRLNRNFGTKLGKPRVVIETLRHPGDTGSDILVTLLLRPACTSFVSERHTGSLTQKKWHILLWGHDNNIKRLRQFCHFKASFKPGLSTFSTPRHEPPLFNWPSLVIQNHQVPLVKMSNLHLSTWGFWSIQAALVKDHPWAPLDPDSSPQLEDSIWQVASFYHGIYRWFDPIQWNFNWCYSFFVLKIFKSKKKQKSKRPQ